MKILEILPLLCKNCWEKKAAAVVRVLELFGFKSAWLCDIDDDKGGEWIGEENDFNLILMVLFYNSAIMTRMTLIYVYMYLVGIIVARFVTMAESQIASQ